MIDFDTTIFSKIKVQVTEHTFNEIKRILKSVE